MRCHFSQQRDDKYELLGDHFVTTNNEYKRFKYKKHERGHYSFYNIYTYGACARYITRYAGCLVYFQNVAYGLFHINIQWNDPVERGHQNCASNVYWRYHCAAIQLSGFAITLNAFESRIFAYYMLPDSGSFYFFDLSNHVLLQFLGTR